MRERDIRALLPEHLQDLENVQRIRDSVLSEHDVADRDDAFLLLAVRLESEWFLEEAIETLEHTEEVPGHKATRLAAIAGKYVTLGSVDHARSLLVSAAQIARSLPYRNEAADTLIGVAEFAEGAMSLKSRVGLLLEARDAALEEHIHGDQQDSVDAAKILASIAVELALLRQDKEAGLCADSIKYEQYRASAHSRIGAIEQRRE